MTTPATARRAEAIRRRLAALEGADEIVIYDLEYTAWEGSLARNWGGDAEYRELVQIGAVRLANQQGYPEIASFERLALPVFNPALSDYFTKLTGITNADLAAGGESFEEVITDFAAFVGVAKIVAANGDDATCLSENCGWRGVVMPISAERTLSLRPMFMAALDLPREQTISSDLPQHLGLAMDGPAHTGLADARAIALALREIFANFNAQVEDLRC
ncbi:MAG: exonuclease domain-containing protein [Proteobacteria bacterium]|nr:exonuclease domain-containing protein [Pseudomonadota bacterium]